jgi:hypothetical protein
MYTQAPKIAQGASNRQVFCGVSAARPRSRFLHMFLVTTFPAMRREFRSEGGRAGLALFLHSGRWKNGDRQRSFRGVALSCPRVISARGNSKPVTTFPAMRREFRSEGGRAGLALFLHSGRWKNGDRQRSFRGVALSCPRVISARGNSKPVTTFPAMRREFRSEGGRAGLALFLHSGRWKNGDRQRSFRGVALSCPRVISARGNSKPVTTFPAMRREFRSEGGRVGLALFLQSGRWKNGDRQRSFRGVALSCPRVISARGNSKPVTTFPAMRREFRSEGGRVGLALFLHSGRWKNGDRQRSFRGVALSCPRVISARGNSKPVTTFPAMRREFRSEGGRVQRSFRGVALSCPRVISARGNSKPVTTFPAMRREFRSEGGRVGLALFLHSGRWKNGDRQRSFRGVALSCPRVISARGNSKPVTTFPAMRREFRSEGGRVGLALFLHSGRWKNGDRQRSFRGVALSCPRVISARGNSQPVTTFPAMRREFRSEGGRAGLALFLHSGRWKNGDRQRSFRGVARSCPRVISARGNSKPVTTFPAMRREFRSEGGRVGLALFLHSGRWKNGDRQRSFRISSRFAWPCT